MLAVTCRFRFGIRIGEPESVENPDLEALHHLGIGLVTVIVTHQMQRAMHDEMCQMRYRVLALLIRLPSRDGPTDDKVTEFRIRLGATACRFLKGHRIRLEITSSDFPNHDRNHNTGGADLADTELVTAEQKVFHTARFPSRLIVAVHD